MDLVGVRKVKTATNQQCRIEQKGPKKSCKNEQSRRIHWPMVSLLLDCNCDPKRTRRGQPPTRDSRVSGLSRLVVSPMDGTPGNCPKLYLFAWLALLCLIAAKQSSPVLCSLQLGIANRSHASVEAAAAAAALATTTTEPSQEVKRNRSGCLPIIGSLFGIGYQCDSPATEQQTESTTMAAAASTMSVPDAKANATATAIATMRYESLKLNQSATAELWNGGQVKQEVGGPSPSTNSSLAAAAAAASNFNNATNVALSTKPQPRALSSGNGNINGNGNGYGGAASSKQNVLCNSRCNCVILDLSSPSRQLVTPDTSKLSLSSSSSSSSSIAVEAAASSSGPTMANRDESASQTSEAAAASRSGSSGADVDQVNQALIAFNEDYSLDYEQSQPEQQQQQQAQQILFASSNPSSVETNSSTGQTMRQAQLQPQESSQQQQQQQQQQHQLSPTLNNNNDMQLFPLQHHHHAGSGGHASSPQLFAQLHYSSQAPKLSYHAHAPYLKQSASSSSSSSSSSSMSSGPSNLNAAAAAAANLNANFNSNLSPQNPQSGGGTISSLPSEGATALPGVGQTNYHIYHHNLRANYHHTGPRHHSIQNRPGQQQQQQQQGQDIENALANDQLPTVRQVQVQALIPIQVLNVSNSEQIRQTDNLSSIIADANSKHDAKVPESLLNGLENLLTRIELENVQSLILSHNQIEFEYWTELYALLAGAFRKNIYHLDLSHNSLAKLGITFTGYLEHHLAAHDGIWFQQQQQQPNSASSSQNSTTSHNETLLLPTKTTSQQQKAIPNSKSGSASTNNRVNSLFNGGKLYSLVRDRFLNSFNEQTTNPLLTLARNQDNTTIKQHNKQLISKPMLIRALDLSHNKLKWLINDQFKALKHVQTIRLDHNRIRYIHQHAFSGLESMRFLNLNHNRLQVIYIEQFQTNYNLLALMLRSNYLAYLRGGTFASLSQLKRLDVSQNKLTILSNNAFIGLESLELLNCSSNQFVHVPSGSFHPLTSLKKLDLSNNLITELAPGTFFHLPIEELWLNQNDQLVTIERGALWDLPYLSRLHLNSNPMLMNINSQSFVSSTQNLQFIDIEDCQSLDANARQLLENITMTATARKLRLEQQQSPIMAVTPPSISGQLIATLEPVSRNNSGLSNTSTLLSPMAATAPQDQDAAIGTGGSSPPPVGHKGSNTLLLGKHLQQSKDITKYLYYMGTITLLIVALKLVFKYTSTSHYLESRRRRRRVYELDSTTSQQQQNPSGSSSSSTSVTNRKYSIGSYSASQVSTASPSECDSVFVCGSEQQPPAGHFELYESANNVIVQHHHPAHSLTSIGGDDCGDSDGNEQLRVDDNSAGHQGEELDISVINVSPSVNPSMLCCPDCDSGNHLVGGAPVGGAAAAAISGPSDDCPSDSTTTTTIDDGQAGCCHQMGGTSQQQQQPLQADNSSSSNQQQEPSIELIQSQLIAAGFDCGHANCAHFYQSLGPALQLADMTANFVNSMDYY